MAQTGEECIHQFGSRIYVDGGGDLLFDAQMPVYCRAFSRRVNPSTQCGTICLQFQPIAGTDYTSHALSSSPSSAAQSPRDPAELRHAYLDTRLASICAEIDAAASYLEEQIERRERLWKESDAWLARSDTRADALEGAVIQAQSRLANAQAEFRRIERQLQAIRAGKAHADQLEALWIAKEDQSKEIRHAQHACHDAEERLAERRRKEEEQTRLYTNWEDALQRVPLLRQLRSELERVVGTILALRSSRLSDADDRRILEFLHQVREYANDDAALDDLRAAVAELTAHLK